MCYILFHNLLISCSQHEFKNIVTANTAPVTSHTDSLLGICSSAISAPAGSEPSTSRNDSLLGICNQLESREKSSFCVCRDMPVISYMTIGWVFAVNWNSPWPAQCARLAHHLPAYTARRLCGVTPMSATVA